MSNPFRLVWLVPVICVAACVSTQRPSGLKVPRDQFYPSLKVIAVEPTMLKRDMDDRVRKQFQDVLELRLRGEGFQVIPATKLVPMLEAASVAKGPIFDPVTGELDKAKQEAVYDDLRRAVREKYHVDAMLRSALVEHVFYVSGKNARWDGATQEVGGSKWWARDWSGKLRGLSLQVSLIDSFGLTVYVKRGGIQLLDSVDHKGEISQLPGAEVLTDNARNEEAVDLALGELFGKEVVLSRKNAAAPRDHRTAEAGSPFKIPREQFYPSLRVVAVAPILLLPGQEDEEQVREELDAFLEDQLRGAGLTVVPARETEPVIQAVLADTGGAFDPLTGAVVEAKRRRTPSEVVRRLGADALLRPEVVSRLAWVDHDRAEWDGMTQGNPAGFWKRFWSFPLKHSATVPASSVEVSLLGPDGEVFYSKLGGLRLMCRMDEDDKVLVDEYGFPLLLPLSDLFADKERNARAIHLALDELLGVHTPPAGAK